MERHKNVSQRRLAEYLGMAVSLVNRLIRELLDGGYVDVVDRGVRPYAYDVTAEGRTYLRRLSYEHYRSVLGSYRELQERIQEKLRRIRDDGVRRMVCYGGGDMMEATYPLGRALGLDVVGVVDDDPGKQGTRRDDLVVQPRAAIEEMEPDVVLITTLRYTAEIRERMPEGVRGSVRVVEL